MQRPLDQTWTPDNVAVTRVCFLWPGEAPRIGMHGGGALYARYGSGFAGAYRGDTASPDMTFTESLFPQTERVLYSRSPLTQVICQIRFPSILRIESQAPADFQEKIRHAFPIFERAGGAGAQQIPPEFAQFFSMQEGGTSYVFKTEDESYKFTLSGGSISLTCEAYTRWEAFERNLSTLVQAFVDVYKPSFYSRIGLRYINIISREDLGLEGAPWVDLLRPEIVGELSLPQWEARSFEARSTIRVKMSNDAGSIFFQHGLAQAGDGEALVYAIDFDFYKDTKTEVGDAGTVLEGFHERSGRAFRWCIKEQLHSALGPQQPDAQHG